MREGRKRVVDVTGQRGHAAAGQADERSKHTRDCDRRRRRGGLDDSGRFCAFLDKTPTRIRLIESDEIGIVGVGEATVPVIQAFNGVLGLDEREFLKRTKGTFKLGIEFRDWGWIGNEYFHAFGDFGDSIEGVSPHHHWLKLHRGGDESSLFAHSFPYAAGRLNRFAPPPINPRADQPSYKYAYHFRRGALRAVSARLR